MDIDCWWARRPPRRADWPHQSGSGISKSLRAIHATEAQRKGIKNLCASVASLSLWHILLIRRLHALLIEREADEADHHFFPRLLTPAHRFSRIGIPFVLHRVVEMRDALQA